MSDDAFDISFDPSKETRFRWQREKETLGASSHHSEPPWKEGDQLHDFVLERLLGSGSSGFVYRALDVRTNRRCALKLLTHGSPDDLLRNKLGFRRMMSIEHPNLLRVDRIYQLGNHIALSMEEIEGCTFKQAVHRLQLLPPEDAYRQLLGLLRHYASGLAMMHANGYIHRDVKPDNLMVETSGRGRVIDYGLVDAFELVQPSFAGRGFLLGTPHYFAPEVIWSQCYLPAGDIFSLGIVILDALREIESASGRRQAELERCRNSQHDDAERIDQAIEELSESVPTTIREACREMLDRSPSDRPTAMELSRLGVPRSLSMLWLHEEPIVGRDAERREIVAWVEQVFCGKVGRLHLSGPAGIGKTRLIEQVIKHIESKNWGQVFHARCRVREDQPLQAFDQICDAITHRYMQGDRERLELDPVSAGLLQEIFPVLKSVLKCNMQLPMATNEPVESIDALEAAARMSDQLRLVGPLFLIVDDVQWADRDSLNVLDRLQTAVGREGLGIITVSRDPEDPQRLPANHSMRLGPLELEPSIAILARGAQRWGLEIPSPTLQRLAKATGGSPFRLRELADEFRPGGYLSEISCDEDSPLLITSLEELEELWKRRADRLSPEAKQTLTYVATAGGLVSTKQLGTLTGLGDAVDAAISELARQRLITDEATGGECITIFHDQVADELIRTLSEEANQKAHHEWAVLLSKSENSETFSGRIASHFFSAGEPGRAVAYAILAAEDAERRAAITEAARWYSRVVDHVDGAEKIKALRHAARLHHQADFPLAAADHYRQLAELVDHPENIECRMLAISLLIRSGRYSWAREQLLEIASFLGLPKPKSAWRSSLALSLGMAARLLPGRKSLLRCLTEADASCFQDATDTAPSASDPNSVVSLVQDHSSASLDKTRAVRFCDSLIRPMSLFNNLYAAELSLAGSRLSRKYGTTAERIRFAIGEAVFGCYDQGKGRIEGETSLLTLKPRVAELNCASTKGDLWAGIAYSHALACRWNQVMQPVELCVQQYQQVGKSHGFEIAHTQWLDLWAKWNLGRWKPMRSIAERLLEDALRRNDLLQQLLTVSGFGGAAWLASDQVEAWQRLRLHELEADGSGQSIQVLQFFNWISSLQLLLYQGAFHEAWNCYEAVEPQLRRMPYSRIQLFRVCAIALGTLTALHNLSRDCSHSWRLRTQVRIDRLRREQILYAKTLANFFDGLLQICIARHGGGPGNVEAAKILLTEARNQAAGAYLRPLQFAAEEKLAELHNGMDRQVLDARMRKHGIVRPEHFRRLYTIQLD